jgi:leader peptidase (prepilin peptidase)/N-methyltransferase
MTTAISTALFRPARPRLLPILPIAAAVAAWCASSATFGWIGFAAGAALVPAGVAAAADLATERIPDRLVLLGALPIVLALALAGHALELLAGVLVGALGMAGPLLAVHLVAPTAMGWGDVKLAAVLGASLGLVDASLVVVGLALGSAATLLAALASRRSALAFAPGLVGGAAVALAAVAIAALELPR